MRDTGLKLIACLALAVAGLAALFESVRGYGDVVRQSGGLLDRMPVVWPMLVCVAVLIAMAALVQGVLGVYASFVDHLREEQAARQRALEAEAMAADEVDVRSEGADHRTSA